MNTRTHIGGFMLEIEGDRYRRSGALFSPDQRYRYVLTREWGTGPHRLVVIGLNPSTADATQDDPTIRRCIGFAKREKCDSLVMLNLFALRATNPKVMLAAADPVGPENDRHIEAHAWGADRVVLAAWGAHGSHQGRATAVGRITPELWCLGTTKDGHPRHPLYVRADAPLVRCDEAWP